VTSAATGHDPVLIVGTPRSGTSLLRAILNRHSAIGLCDETYFFYYVANRRRAFGDLADPSNRARAVDRYMETRRIKRLGLDREALASRMKSEGVDAGALFSSLLRFYAESKGKRRYGEKTPQHALEAERLAAMFPAGRIIHLVRDPRDVVASLLRMPWGANDAVSNARLWRACVTGAERGGGSDILLRVRYEDLVLDPERVLRDVCEHLGEAFEPSMLTSDEGEDADRWWFERAQGPLTRKRVEKWRGDLTPGQVALVECVAGPLLTEMGYEPSGATASAAAKVRGALRATLSAGSRRMRSLPSAWYRWFRPDQLPAEETAIDRDS